MKYFYLTKTWPSFKGFEENDSKVAIIGVGFDSTSTFKPGSRFAPRKIREVSLELEDYLPLFDAYTENLKVKDLGDLDVATGNVEETLRRLTETIKEILEDKLTPIVIGGEHTITLGILRAYGKPVNIVVVDAHLDARDEYPIGVKTSHATVFRRLAEEGLIKHIIYLGARAFTREEREFISEYGEIYTPMKYNLGLKAVKGFDDIYLTIDIDAIDPSQAPGVGNPEPGGITFNNLLNLFKTLRDKKIIGADVVEVNPLVDVNDITSTLAAKVIEYIIYLANRNFSTA